MRPVIRDREDVTMSEQAGKKTFTLGTESAQLLEELAERYYADNQTETVRVALRSLAARLGVGETNWVVDGYVPARAMEGGTCQLCARPLVRQAKLDASCGVKVPIGKGLTIHPYRVLQLWRR
jgi:hypothetical protein